MSQDIRPFYSSDELPQSPKPPTPQFRGVLVAAAPQSAISLHAPLVLIHGTYRIQGSDYPKIDRIRLTAIDTVTKKQFTAFAGQSDPSPDVPPPPSEPPDPAVASRMIFSGFFNADLMATLGLPFTNATYQVRAEFGKLPSNEVTIQIIVQK